MHTLDDLCREIVDGGPAGEPLDPHCLAAVFVRFFGLSVRPAMDELTGLLHTVGVGSVSGAPLPRGLRGIHASAPEGGYDIHYREDQWEGAQEHTVLHETYEIICETLSGLHPGSPPIGNVCREADRFAAAVLMQPGPFAAYARATGFDVVALQKRYGRAYASVTLRLGEVMRDQPLVAVLYERGEKGEPSAWTEPPAPGAFRVKVAARTPGFGTTGSRFLSQLAGRHAAPRDAAISRLGCRARSAHRAERHTPRRAPSPSLPGPSSGMGGWRRWPSLPCLTATGSCSCLSSPTLPSSACAAAPRRHLPRPACRPGARRSSPYPWHGRTTTRRSGAALEPERR